MQCPKCGAVIQKSNARFCENCGAVLSKKIRGRRTQNPEKSFPSADSCEPETGVKTYVLRCKSCGGTLNRTEDEDVLICPYCGSKEIMEESDAVKIEKVKAEAALERQKILAENRREKNRRVQNDSFRKKLFLIFSTFLLCIGLFGILMGFVTGAYSSGVIAIVQSAFVILALITCFKVKEPKYKNLPKALIILTAILIIPYVSLLAYDTPSSYSRYSSESIDWDSLDLSSVLPEPENRNGHVYSNTQKRLSCDINPYTLAQFKSYVAACKEAGFTVDIESPNERSFTAYNEEGYHVNLYWYTSDEYMSLSLDAPIEMSEFTWPTHGLAGLLPTPASKIGRIEGDSGDYFSAYVGETSKADYSAYVTAVMDAGFDVDYYRNDSSFSAENADGVRVNIYFEGNKTMSIRLYDYN